MVLTFQPQKERHVVHNFVYANCRDSWAHLDQAVASGVGGCSQWPAGCPTADTQTLPNAPRHGTWLLKDVTPGQCFRSGRNMPLKMQLQSASYESLIDYSLRKILFPNAVHLCRGTGQCFFSDPHATPSFSQSHTLWRSSVRLQVLGWSTKVLVCRTMLIDRVSRRGRKHWVAFAVEKPCCQKPKVSIICNNLVFAI